MSISTKAILKPKRPLSGYNLFYRYKRNKVLEATSRTDAAGDDERRNEDVIRGVLTALPGLEGLPPDAPVLDLPPPGRDEFRAAAIREAMEGKLFPNENGRTRVHCKVHGMGFVEMGRTMRQMWGRADKFTKDLFCELADVGRVRYKRLVAEYKYQLTLARPEDAKGDVTPDCGADGSAETPASRSARTVTKSEGAAPAGSFLSTLAAAAAIDLMTTEATARAKASATASETIAISRRARSTFDSVLEARSAWATRNAPPAVAGAASSEHKKGSGPRFGRRVSFDHYLRAPDRGRARRYLESLAFETAMNHPAAHAGLDPRDDALLELLRLERAAFKPVEADRYPAAPKMSYLHGRRVSTDVPPALNGPMGAVARGDGGAGSHPADADLDGLKANLELRQMELQGAIQNLRDKIVRNDSLLPPGMRVYPRSPWDGTR